MIYSRASLAVVDAASTDPRRRALNSVHLAEDGSTVAADGRTLVAVSPVREKDAHFPIEEHASPPSGGTCVDLDIVVQATKNLPRDRRPITQFAALTRCDDQVEFTTTDLRKTQRVGAAPVRDLFPNWRKALAHALRRAKKTRICVDRKRLQALLKTLDAAAGEGDVDSPVFIEVGEEKDALVLRAESPNTGQRIVAMLTPLDTKGEWLKRNKWERRILDEAI